MIGPPKLMAELLALITVAEAASRGQDAIVTLFHAHEVACQRLYKKGFLARPSINNYSLTSVGQVVIASLINHYNTIRNNAGAGEFIVEVTSPKYDRTHYLIANPHSSSWSVTPEIGAAHIFPSTTACTNAASIFISSQNSFWGDTVTIHVRQLSPPTLPPPPLPPPLPPPKKTKR